MSDKDYLTPRELAKRWDFAENTLAIWRFRGKGPKFYKKGYRKVVYMLEDITHFEEQNPGFGV